MGANCCIAAKQRPEPSVASVEVSAYRTRHSPSWSFRWDNRTHIEDIMENAALFSNHSSGNIRPELKSGSIAPTEGHPNEDNLPDVFRGVKCQKPDKKMEASKRSKAGLQGIVLNKLMFCDFISASLCGFLFFHLDFIFTVSIVGDCMLYIFRTTK
ncbi:unnamed protein product [Triticum turgidum subsp. durum]|uniref:Uncharacterized protein n=1 Tax=Triticum turgidum subsp. durum TaxID=4567 RepID=A0A9R0VIN2_TRITD|nr:unnamed protein product [Triticum turgidum subsp. durum]